MPQYISTDPNAGLESAGAYLSTDPADGDAPVAQHPHARFGEAVIKGLKREAGGLADMASALMRPPAADERIAAGAGPVGVALLRGVRAIQQAGGPMAVVKGLASDIGNNLAHPIQSFNEDPIGMASNLSLLAAPAKGVMLRRTAESAYGKALKLPDTIRKRNPTLNMNRVGLDAGVPVSGAGIERNAKAIEALENQIGTAVDASPARTTLSLSGMPASQAEIASSGKLTAANPDRANVKGRIEQFLEDPNIKDQPLSMRDIQNNKIEVGRLAYDRAAIPSQAASDANQALYKDLSATLTGNVPEVAGLNTELGPRYALQDAITHRVPVAERRDVVPMAGAVGAQAVGGGWGKRVVAAMVNAAITQPAVLSRAAITMDAAGKRVAALGKTARKLAPFATMDTFARVLQGDTPTGDEARTRGQIVTGAVSELMDQPDFARLPLDQQDQAIQQLVEDVSLLVGGTADVTQTKARSTKVLKSLMASHATERP